MIKIRNQKYLLSVKMCYWGRNLNMVLGMCGDGMEGHSSRVQRIARK